jgi:hypothetical protein
MSSRPVSASCPAFTRTDSRRTATRLGLAVTVALAACTNAPPDDADDADAGNDGVFATGGTGSPPGVPTAPPATPTGAPTTPPATPTAAPTSPPATPTAPPSDPGGGGECPENPDKYALTGNHIVAQISWPANIGVEAGSGTLHIWTMTELHWDQVNADGSVPVVGKVQPCGSVIPALTKTFLAGGGQVQTVIPDAVWDAPGMPEFTANGVLGGFGPGATVSMQPVTSLVGATLPDPDNSPWPAKGSELSGFDHDGDGQPGIKALPRTDAGFSAPPLSLEGALNPNGPRASELFLATRTRVQLDGQRDSCATASGPAAVHLFESHVIGCRRNDGSICSSTESDFIDSNQPAFTIGGATYTMAQLPDGATCADVRAALPM